MNNGNALLALFLCGAVAIGVVACSDHDQVRSSVVMCESAVQHIKKCCGSPPRVSCEYAYNVPILYCDPDCKPTEVEPEFSEAASTCILAKSCVEITGIGACSPASDTTAASGKILAGLGCDR